MIFARQQGRCFVLEQANENWNVRLAGPARHKQGDLRPSANHGVWCGVGPNDSAFGNNRINDAFNRDREPGGVGQKVESGFFSLVEHDGGN